MQTETYTYVGVPPTKLSGLHKFEAPDPAEWCARGYAIVQADARGCFNSEGDMYTFGSQVCGYSNFIKRWMLAYSLRRKHKMGMI
jgi:hypothetical protein